MFGNKSSTPKEISSLVGAGSTVNGDLTFKGGLRIDGTVRGSVRSAEGDAGGILVVSEQGSIEGEVRAAHLVVSGSISGPVFATELIELQPKAKVNGDVHYRALEMHHGAIVEGRLVHDSSEKEGRGGVKLAIAANASSGEPKTHTPRG
jgi:cytoskeletal protein CcmA (bactofilin family)